MQFDEEMVRFNFYGVDSADIGHNFINEVRRHVNTTWSMDCFDFRSILKDTAITDVQSVLRYINILHIKRKDFPDTHRRLITESHPKTVQLIGACIKQCLYLGYRDCLRSLSFLFLLSQEVLRKW